MTANTTTNGAAAAAPTNPPQNTTTSSTTKRPSLTLRRPSSLSQLTPPDPNFFTSAWHITHSTMPIWRDKRNVTIAYTLLSDAPSPQLDDVVAYRPRAGAKVKTVRGAQTSAAGKEEGCGASWDWRGKGLIRVASAHWELLGVGARMLEEIREALVGTGHSRLGKLAGELYEVARRDAVER